MVGVDSHVLRLGILQRLSGMEGFLMTLPPIPRMQPDSDRAMFPKSNRAIFDGINEALDFMADTPRKSKPTEGQRMALKRKAGRLRAKKRVEREQVSS